MKGRGLLVGAVAILIALTAFSMALHTGAGAASSVLSRSADGWLGVRRVLEAHEAETEILDVALDRRAVSGVLVVAFPWQSARPEEHAAALAGHVWRGGTLLIGYSGNRRAAHEKLILEDLDLPLEEAREVPPLNPWAWRRYSREVWSLVPDPVELSGAGVARVSALRNVPRMPEGGRALFRNDAGLPVVFACDRGPGQVLVMPSEMLTNGRLSESGNADWAATLARSLRGPWTFDEYHHGLAGIADAAHGDVRTERFLDLYLGQLAFLYVLAVLALARRFGPAWKETPVVSGTVARFLVGLGGMHARLGHHQDAAAALLQRAAELDKRMNVAAFALPQGPVGPPEFLALARAVARTEGRTRG